TAYADSPTASVNKTEEHDLTKGVRIAFEYDALNRETSRSVFLEGTGSTGEVYTTRTDYDDSVHARTVTDPNGSKTRTVFDGLDRPIEQTVDVGRLKATTAT